MDIPLPGEIPLPGKQSVPPPPPRRKKLTDYLIPILENKETSSPRHTGEEQNLTNYDNQGKIKVNAPEKMQEPFKSISLPPELKFLESVPLKDIEMPPSANIPVKINEIIPHKGEMPRRINVPFNRNDNIMPPNREIPRRMDEAFNRNDNIMPLNREMSRRMDEPFNRSDNIMPPNREMPRRMDEPFNRNDNIMPPNREMPRRMDEPFNRNDNIMPPNREMPRRMDGQYNRIDVIPPNRDMPRRMNEPFYRNDMMPPTRDMPRRMDEPYNRNDMPPNSDKPRIMDEPYNRNDLMPLNRDMPRRMDVSFDAMSPNREIPRRMDGPYNRIDVIPPNNQIPIRMVEPFNRIDNINTRIDESYNRIDVIAPNREMPRRMNEPYNRNMIPPNMDMPRRMDESFNMMPPNREMPRMDVPINKIDNTMPPHMELPRRIDESYNRNDNIMPPHRQMPRKVDELFDRSGNILPPNREMPRRMDKFYHRKDKTMRYERGMRGRRGNSYDQSYKRGHPTRKLDESHKRIENIKVHVNDVVREMNEPKQSVDNENIQVSEKDESQNEKEALSIKPLIEKSEGIKKGSLAAHIMLTKAVTQNDKSITPLKDINKKEPPKIKLPTLGKNNARRLLKSFTAYSLPKKPTNEEIKKPNIEEIQNPLNEELKKDNIEESDSKSLNEKIEKKDEHFLTNKKKKKDGKQTVISQIMEEETKLKKVILDGTVNNFNQNLFSISLSSLQGLIDNPDAMKKFEDRSINLKEKIESKKMDKIGLRKIIDKDNFEDSDSKTKYQDKKKVEEDRRKSPGRQSSKARTPDRKRSKTRSPDRRRSRTRTPDRRRSRTRTPDRKGSRARTPDRRRSRTRTPDRKRKRSRSSSLSDRRRRRKRSPKNWKEHKESGWEVSVDSPLKSLRGNDYLSYPLEDGIWIGLSYPKILIPMRAKKSFGTNKKEYSGSMVRTTVTKPHITFSINSGNYSRHYMNREEIKFRNNQTKHGKYIWKIMTDFWNSNSFCDSEDSTQFNDYYPKDWISFLSKFEDNVQNLNDQMEHVQTTDYTFLKPRDDSSEEKDIESFKCSSKFENINEKPMLEATKNEKCKVKDASNLVNKSKRPKLEPPKQEKPKTSEAIRFNKSKKYKLESSKEEKNKTSEAVKFEKSEIPELGTLKEEKSKAHIASSKSEYVVLENTNNSPSIEVAVKKVSSKVGKLEQLADLEGIIGKKIENASKQDIKKAFKDLKSILKSDSLELGEKRKLKSVKKNLKKLKKKVEQEKKRIKKEKKRIKKIEKMKNSKKEEDSDGEITDQTQTEDNLKKTAELEDKQFKEIVKYQEDEPIDEVSNNKETLQNVCIEELKQNFVASENTVEEFNLAEETFAQESSQSSESEVFSITPDIPEKQTYCDNSESIVGSMSETNVQMETSESEHNEEEKIEKTQIIKSNNESKISEREESKISESEHNEEEKIEKTQSIKSNNESTLKSRKRTSGQDIYDPMEMTGSDEDFETYSPSNSPLNMSPPSSEIQDEKVCHGISNNARKVEISPFDHSLSSLQGAPTPVPISLSTESNTSSDISSIPMPGAPAGKLHKKSFEAPKPVPLPSSIPIPIPSIDPQKIKALVSTAHSRLSVQEFSQHPKEIEKSKLKDESKPVAFKLSLNKPTTSKLSASASGLFQDEDELPEPIMKESKLSKLNDDSDIANLFPIEKHIVPEKTTKKESILQTAIVLNKNEAPIEDYHDSFKSTNDVKQKISSTKVSEVSMSEKSKLISKDSDAKTKLSTEEKIPDNVNKKERIESGRDRGDIKLVDAGRHSPSLERKTDHRSKRSPSAERRRRHSPKRRERSRSKSPYSRKRESVSRRYRRSPHKHRRSRSRSPRRSSRSPRRSRSRSPRRSRNQDDRDRKHGGGKELPVQAQSIKPEYHSQAIPEEPSPQGNIINVNISDRNDENPYLDEFEISSPKRPSLMERLRTEHGLTIDDSPENYENPADSYDVDASYWQEEQVASNPGAKVIQVGNMLQILPQEIPEPVQEAVTDAIATQTVENSLSENKSSDHNGKESEQKEKITDRNKEITNEKKDLGMLSPSMTPPREGNISPLPSPSPDVKKTSKPTQPMILPAPIPGLSSEALISAAAAAAAASNVPFSQLLSVLQQQNLLPKGTVECAKALQATKEAAKERQQKITENKKETNPNIDALKKACKERKERKRQEKERRRAERRRLKEEQEAARYNESKDDDMSDDDEAIIKEAISEVPDLEGDGDYEPFDDEDFDLEEFGLPKRKVHPSLKLPPPEKGILVIPTYIADENQLVKSVSFADGVLPGEGTDASGDEGGEMHSPPPPSQKVPNLKPKKLRNKRKPKFIKQYEPNIYDGISSPPPPPMNVPPADALHLYPGMNQYTMKDTGEVIVYTQQLAFNPQPAPVENQVMIPPGMLVHSAGLM